MKNKADQGQKEAFSNDAIGAVDAKYEAQKIAFAPLTFQAAKSLRDLGILQVLFDANEDGVTREELGKKVSLDAYALGVLLDMGLSMDLVKIRKGISPLHFLLGKIGFFLLHDAMTRANMDFVHDVCFKGSYYLEDSLKSGKPEGLKVFGDWPSIYEGFSSLPGHVQKSWYAFDHYYSDGAFPAALKVVFGSPRKNILDIGGNTAKWACACVNYDSKVKVTIVDLPGQAEVARRNVREKCQTDRITVFEADMLDEHSMLPKGHDVVWMSQFLDCFSLPDIVGILRKVHQSIDYESDVFVMEPLWDKQLYRAATYSLHATSLYFTSMANGSSKMYESTELIRAVETAGFVLVEEMDQLGPNSYTILKFKKRKR